MNKKILLYLALGIVVLLLILFTAFPSMTYAIKDFSSDSEDKCSPPEGVSQEDWNEHMSHHPNMYKECLS